MQNLHNQANFRRDGAQLFYGWHSEGVGGAVVLSAVFHLSSAAGYQYADVGNEDFAGDDIKYFEFASGRYSARDFSNYHTVYRFDVAIYLYQSDFCVHDFGHLFYEPHNEFAHAYGESDLQDTESARRHWPVDF